jgi:heme/copper-type cytochrome/quinol oxidase subunit 3
MTEQVDIVPRSEKDKLGVWIFLGGEVILFGTLILTILVSRLKYAAQYPDFKDHLSIPLVGANTLILVFSSYLVVRALQAAHRENPPATRRYLLGVMVGGALFLSGQAIEWAALFREGIAVDDVFGTPFFTVTGIHGTHVLIGLAWASFVLINTLFNSKSKQNVQGIEIFGLYWHFVDIVWIVLFSLIYLV